jgi:putative heme-binding domain-containing protein
VFEKDPAVQALAAARVADEAVAPEARLRLIEAMAESKLPEVPAAWVSSMGRLIESTDAATRAAALKALAVLRPKELDGRLAALASDPARPAPERLEALRAVIARRPRLDAATFELLLTRLDPAAQPLDRLAAASLVGQAELSEDQALAVLERAAGDPVVSPAALLRPLESLRGERVDAATLAFLRAALARGWEPAGPQIEPLLAKVSGSRRADADAIRAAVRDRAQRRRAKLAEYEPLLAGGDAARGRAVFFGKTVACGTCHRVGEEGGRVGPDLTKVGAVRAGRDILESVVLPSSTIARGYDHYVAQTNSGEVHAGVIDQPGADVLELRDAAGNVTRLHKGRVKRLQLQPMSLMPDGLAAAMSADEFRDLLAYLQSLK